MRVLFSTIGSRGDVRPIVALASHLKALGHEVRVCMPPDFRNWIESLGIPEKTLDVRSAFRHAAHQADFDPCRRPPVTDLISGYTPRCRS